jgi:hypothetical protein
MVATFSFFYPEIAMRALFELLSFDKFQEVIIRGVAGFVLSTSHSNVEENSAIQTVIL